MKIILRLTYRSSISLYFQYLFIYEISAILRILNQNTFGSYK